ncbi:copper homeostasis protein CutC [Aquimarina sp. 2201CG14-23]|uniref:copper homeostasis protein CutC n=1 Tax=Aquimarina mycalae TaxID=3040073 RepID=UPI002477DC15|nr:copper homeostasis protein CutC [Aquimarina sp. 2201CG14-23]MDH7444872.1 copper homeostasis protein CutC [Aquimarina sp. 2201CG14-23]
MKIEICANSYQSAINAERAGADRIELCVELAVGGITPSHGLIEKVVQELSIPVFVLIRPRSGNFTYTSDEFDVIKKDIEYCKSVGCKGIVSGILMSDNTIDTVRTKELITISKPMSFTFHRAFDWAPKPLDSLKQLIAIGVERILTSGQEIAAIEGIELLKNALEQSKQNMIIMPGGGINAENATVFKEAGFKEIHFSATSLKQVIDTPKITMNSVRFSDETTVAISNYDKIVEIKNLLDQ